MEVTTDNSHEESRAREEPRSRQGSPSEGQKPNFAFHALLLTVREWIMYEHVCCGYLFDYFCVCVCLNVGLH